MLPHRMVGMADFPKRGEIWFVRLDPTQGSEIKKTRPALIISNNINNQFSPLVTALPISDKGEKVYPFEVLLPLGNTGLSKVSKVRCQQIRTVDKLRLVKQLGSIPTSLMASIEEALLLHLGMR